MAIAVIIFVAGFAIVPVLVILVTTPNILDVNTESQWISFWGNYLGALTGGVLGIAGAVFVLKETLKDNSRERERAEVLSFCNYLVRKSSEGLQEYQSCLYKLIEYRNKDKSELYSVDMKMQLYNEFLSMLHSGRIDFNELQRNLEIRGGIAIYQTTSFEAAQKEGLELIKAFDEIENNIESIRENDKIFCSIKDSIVNKLNGFMTTLDNYEKELFEKVVK